MVEKTHTAGWWPEFYEPFRNVASKVADWFAPAAEAAHSKDAYEIVLELPGVAEKDIDISVQDGVLTVEGEKRSEKEEKGKSFYFSERRYGAFQRSFRLPEDAVSDAVTAEISDGVLTIRVAKVKPKKSAAKRIQIAHK
jgi:HSP20 family protein